MRVLALIGGSAYLLHLVGDMLTAKGLPLNRTLEQKTTM